MFIEELSILIWVSLDRTYFNLFRLTSQILNYIYVCGKIYFFRFEDLVVILYQS